MDDNTRELLLAIETIVKRETEPLASEIKKINIRLDTEITDRLDSLADGYAGLNEKYDRMETRLDSMDERLDRMDARLGRVEADVAVIKDDVAEIKEIVGRHDRDIAALKKAQ